MRLRPYQANCYTAANQALSNDSRSALVLMPTGTGKTIVFSHIAHDWKNGRVLIVAHREELIFQAAGKIESITGEPPEIEMAEQRAQRHGLLSASNVVITSVQTQNAGRRCDYCGGEGDVDGVKCPQCLDGRERRMQRFDPSDFGLVIIDEAHHSPAATYRRIIKHYGQNPNLRILGVTATADRLDEKALGQIYDTVAYEYGVLDAITDGWLVPIKQEWVVCENLDFSRCRTTAGDLNGGDLEKVMIEEESLHQVTSPTVEIAGDRATLVFAASVAHAELMAEILNRHKQDSAICIHGGTPKEDRRRLLREYSQGRYQFLCGCGVFLEGFDEPRISCVAMARPTKSRALYAQAIGRGTRPIYPPRHDDAAARKSTIALSSKPDLLVLDFVGNSGKHKLISTADILGGDYEDDVIEQAVLNAKKKGGVADMTEELIAAQEQADDERKRRRKAVVATSKHTRQAISPFNVFDMTPKREPGWHKGRQPTEKQKAMLERNGIKTDGLSLHQSSQLIGKIVERREKGLCTFKQAKLLARFGQPTDVEFTVASEVLDAIAKNGWKLPEKVLA